MADPRHGATIHDLVEAFLAQHTDTHGDIEAYCADHPELPDLPRAIADAIRVRRARLDAMRSQSLSEENTSTSVSDDDTTLQLAGKTFGQYTLGKRIGGGGFGEVYEATRHGDHELLAVKILRSEYTELPEVLHRFRNEAHIVSRLRHTGIVPVYEVGDADGRPFIAMAHGGLDLRRYSRAKPLDPIRSAHIIADAADATHCANLAGVVHRDIKPENILVSRDECILVSDFGLAKQLDAETKVTKSLQRLGTPHYMPPEQAEPRLGPITPSCDVYGLGASLYYLLTGRPPFPTTAGVGRDATLHQIAWDRPVAPSKLNCDIPAAIESICLKCLEKHPMDRYASAADLAADLRRFASGKTVLARPMRRSLRMRRWCTRRPVFTSLLAIAILAIIAGTGVSAHFASRAAISAAETEQQTLRAEKAEERQKAVSSDRYRRQYVVDMRAAQAALDAGETPVALKLIAKYKTPTSAGDPRAFEWYYLKRLAESPSPVNIVREGTIWSELALDPAGERLACTDQHGHLTVFTLPDAEESFRIDTRMTHIAFTRDGSKLVALGEPGIDRIIVIDPENGTIDREILTGRITSCMAVKPDGSMCFTGSPGGDLELWSLKDSTHYDLAKRYKNNQSETSLDIHKRPVTAAAFQNDGPLLAIGFDWGYTQVWDIDRSEIVFPGPGHTGDVTGLSFSSDGSMIVSLSCGVLDFRIQANHYGQALVWRADTGDILRTLRPHKKMIAEELQPIAGVPRPPYTGFRPHFVNDDKEFVTTGPRSAMRWRIASGKLEAIYTSGGYFVHAVSVSADGQFVAAADIEGNARVWPTRLAGHHHAVYARHRSLRALRGDDRRLAVLFQSAMELDGPWGHKFANTENRNVSVWSFDGDQAIEYGGIAPYTDTLDVSSHGVFSGPIAVDAPPDALNTQIASIINDESFNTPYALSNDARYLALGLLGGSIELHALGHDEPGWTAEPHERRITAIAYSHDGTLLASGSMDRNICILHARTGEVLANLQGHGREIGGIAFSPDGRRLVSSSGLQRFNSTQPGEVLLWDLTTHQLVLELARSKSDIFPGVAWNPDGTKVFAGSSTADVEEGSMGFGQILVWSIDKGGHAEVLRQPERAQTE